MKKTVYTTLTEKKAKELTTVGKYEKTTPITSRGDRRDMLGNEFKMYKITTIVEEVPQSDVSYYFDESDLNKKYNEYQQSAGAQLYQLNPQKTMRSDDSYSQWEDTLGWHELGARGKQKYIKEALGDYSREEDEWP